MCKGLVASARGFWAFACRWLEGSKLLVFQTSGRWEALHIEASTDGQDRLDSRK